MLSEFLNDIELLKNILCYIIFYRLFLMFIKFFYHKAVKENPIASATIFLILLVLSILVFTEKINFWWLGGPMFFLTIVAIINNFKNIATNNKIIINLLNGLVNIIQLIFLILIFINS
jgi:hypothetical protein